MLATICLALMVVMLGTAAKHSFYESTAQSTQFLKQSVKMSACEQDQSAIARPTVAVAESVCFSPIERLIKPSLTYVTPVTAAPLLI